MRKCEQPAILSTERRAALAVPSVQSSKCRVSDEYHRATTQVVVNLDCGPNIPARVRDKIRVADHADHYAERHAVDGCFKRVPVQVDEDGFANVQYASERRRQ